MTQSISNTVLPPRHTGLVVAVALFLSACSGLQQRTTDTAPSQRQALEQLSAWTITGKASLRNSRASESFSLVWQQQEDGAWIRMSGPLGTGATEIHSDGTWLSINRGGTRETIDISSEEAIAANTGWDLPLQALPHWLRGLPYPALEIEEMEKDVNSDRLLGLRQNGWTLQFQQYSEVQALSLPTRLLLEKNDTRVTVIIRRWELE